MVRISLLIFAWFLASIAGHAQTLPTRNPPWTWSEAYPRPNWINVPYRNSAWAQPSYPAPIAGPYTPCPTFQSGWALSYPAQPFGAPYVASVAYDGLTKLLNLVFNTPTVQGDGRYSAWFASTYMNVTQGVIQTFSSGSSVNPMTIYQTYVVPSYNALILQEINNCVLQFEGSTYSGQFIQSTPVYVPPPPP